MFDFSNFTVSNLTIIWNSTSSITGSKHTMFGICTSSIIGSNHTSYGGFNRTGGSDPIPSRIPGIPGEVSSFVSFSGSF